MIRPSLARLALAALLTAPLGAVAQEAKPAAGPSLLCYAGPSMKTPMDELARTYEGRTGVHVDVEMSDPRSLIERIIVSNKADLFVSHDPFLAVLGHQGVKVRRAWNVASLTPMIAVAKGNPRKIKKLEDLARPGLRIGLTDPRTAITGNIADYMFKKAGVYEPVQANVVKRAKAGRDLAKLLATGELDATFVWNAVVYANRDKIESVEVRPDQRPRRGPDTVVDAPTLGKIELDHVRVTMAQLESSPSPDAARAFAEFVASPEGAAVFTRNGFSPVDPDRPPPHAPRRTGQGLTGGVILIFRTRVVLCAIAIIVAAVDSGATATLGDGDPCRRPSPDWLRSRRNRPSVAAAPRTSELGSFAPKSALGRRASQVETSPWNPLPRRRRLASFAPAGQADREL